MAEVKAHLYMRTCERKVSYRAKRNAKSAVRAMQARGGRAFEIYRCPYCEGWHIGHPPTNSR